MGWTTLQENFLKNAYDNMSAKEIGELLEKSERAIWIKAHRLGLRSGEGNKFKKITEEDLEFVRANYKHMSNQTMAWKLKRTKASICEMKCKLGVSSIRKWTKEEEDLIREAYGVFQTKDIAAILGRSINAITVRAFKLGVKKGKKIMGFKKSQITLRRNNV